MDPNSQQISQTDDQIHNRVREVMNYITWYGFRGQVRLAKEADVSQTAISRVINGKTRPTFNVIRGITEAFERHLGRHIDPRELFSNDGTYPTKEVRELCGPKFKYFTGRTCDPSTGLTIESSGSSTTEGTKPSTKGDQ